MKARAASLSLTARSAPASRRKGWGGLWVIPGSRPVTKPEPEWSLDSSRFLEALRRPPVTLVALVQWPSLGQALLVPPAFLVSCIPSAPEMCRTLCPALGAPWGRSRGGLCYPGAYCLAGETTV